MVKAIKKFNLTLLLILLLAVVLRFYQLTTLPALNADEAAVGYNAYSLLKTGKDEHGNPWPVHFQSFNDYKPGLYFYIVMPFVALFGLSELAVRLPGALFGVGTVFVVWLLIKELFPQRRYLAEIAALFLAISPWHLHFSRGGWEVNVATFFIVLGAFLFLRGLRSPKSFYSKTNSVYFSILSFALSLYTYHAARVVTPLVGLGLLVIYRNQLLAQKVRVIKAGLLGVFLLVPLILDLLGPAGISRAAGVGLFADEGPFWKTNEQRGEHEDLRSPLAVALHNKPINYSLAFLQNYSEHFSGEFLFLSGEEIQRNKVPEMGQMYLASLLFVVFGLLQIARNPSGWGPVLLWLLIAPIPAALTFQSPHALRAQNMIIPLVIISAYGALSLLEWFRRIAKSKEFFYVLSFLLFAFVTWDFTRYLHQYWVHMPKTYDFATQWGMKELAGYIKENGDRYETVVITDRYDQPYIHMLFYLEYPPEQFQENHELTARDKFGFSTVREFGKFKFLSIPDFDAFRDKYHSALIVGTDEEIPFTGHVVKNIHFPSGRVAFQIVSN